MLKSKWTFLLLTPKKQQFRVNPTVFTFMCIFLHEPFTYMLRFYLWRHDYLLFCVKNTDKYEQQFPCENDFVHLTFQPQGYHQANLFKFWINKDILSLVRYCSFFLFSTFPWFSVPSINKIHALFYLSVSFVVFWQNLPELFVLSQ